MTTFETYWRQEFPMDETPRLTSCDPALLPPVLPPYYFKVFGGRNPFTACIGTYGHPVFDCWNAFVDTKVLGWLIRHHASAGIRCLTLWSTIDQEVVSDAVAKHCHEIHELRIELGNKNSRTLLSELQLREYCGRIIVHGCTDGVLLLIAQLRNIVYLKISGSFTDQGLLEYAAQARYLPGTVLGVSDTEYRVFRGEVAARILVIPGVVDVRIDFAIDDPAPIMGLLTSPAGAHLRTLTVSAHGWEMRQQQQFLDCFNTNESIRELYFHYTTTRVGEWIMLPPLCKTLMKSNIVEVPASSNLNEVKSQCRSMAAAILGSDDFAVTVPEAWFPDIVSRVEREAVRLRKLAAADAVAVEAVAAEAVAAEAVAADA